MLPFRSSDVRLMERFQLQCGRFILSASTRVPEETVFGELGWSSIDETFRTAKLKYCNSASLLPPDRKVRIAMTRFISSPDTLSAKTLKRMNSVVFQTKCFEPTTDGQLKFAVKAHFCRKWSNPCPKNRHSTSTGQKHYHRRKRQFFYDNSSQSKLFFPSTCG